jgi:hypothetical protein
MDPSTILTTFMTFNNLPTELRIKIWKYLFPGPRVVSIRFNRAYKQYTTTAAPPTLLHTSPESRAVFLSSYTPLFLSPKYPSSVFVDFANDTIFFDSLDCSPGGDLAYDLLQSPHSDCILSCAIDVELWEVLRVFRYASLSEIKWMRNLKTIALVMPKENPRIAGGDGPGSVVVNVEENSLTADILHDWGHIECLRRELENMDREHWGNGVPNMQLWLW